jgi:hypothetical protein
LILKGKKYFIASDFFCSNNHKAAIKSTSIVVEVQLEGATSTCFSDNILKMIVQNGQNRQVTPHL